MEKICRKGKQSERENFSKLKRWRENETKIATKEILEQKQNKGKKILQLAKITTLFPNWWRSLSQKKG